MSMLERLSVRGIRNFGVDAENEQKISFSTPLTLILGANGCGKTTIIECLKYALTGEMPPNCKDGQGFIHDPKVLNLPESLGQVKLKIKNLQQGSTTISRSAKVMIKGKKVQFKSLDATLTIDKNGEEICITKRNAEASDIMCDQMGVSKAIINNVLFCHQEDANWPLGTDQELMTKFDKIFGTTEYNNALEKMRKKSKELELGVKDLNVSLKELELIKKDADTRNVELSTQEEKLEQLKQSYDKCDVGRQPLEKEIKEILAVEQNLSKVVVEKTKVETEHTNKKENREKLIKNIKEIFNGTIDDLQSEIRLFKQQVLRKDQELSNLKLKMEQVKQQQCKVNEKFQENDRKFITFIGQREQEQNLFAEKAVNVRELCNRLRIKITFDLENCNERSNELLPAIKSGMSQEEEYITEIYATNEQIQYEQDTQIGQLRDKSVRIESEITTDRKQLLQLKESQTKLIADISEAKQSANNLKGLLVNIHKVSETYDSVKASSDTEQLRKNIAENRLKNNQMIDEIEGFDEQIAFLSSISTLTAEIGTKEAFLEKRESEMRRIKNKHGNNLRKLFKNEVIELNFKQRIDATLQRLQMEISKLEKESRESERKETMLSSDHKSMKQQLTQMKTELRDLEEKIYEKCQSTPFIEVLESTKENVKKYHMEHSTLKSAELFYKKYITKIKDEPCCPLCHKDLNINEVDDLTGDLSGQIELLPLTINRAEKTFQEENGKLEELLKLQTIVDNELDLKSDKIPKHKKQLIDIEKKLSAAQMERSNLEKSIEEPKILVELVISMSGDMSLLDEAIRDIDRIRKELTGLKGSLPNTDNDLTMDELQRRRKSIADKEKELRNETSRLEAREKKDEGTLRDLQNKLLELRSEEIKLQKSVQSLDTMLAHENEMKNQIKETNIRLEKKQASLVPIKCELEQANQMKEETKRKNMEKLQIAQKNMSELKRYIDAIKRCSQELDKLKSLNLEDKILQCKKILTKLNDEKNKQTKDIEITQKLIDQLNKDISEQVVTERDLQDNLELKNVEKEITILNEKITGFESDVGEIDFDEMTKRKDILLRKREALCNERNNISGKRSAVLDQVKHLKELLNNPKYKNSLQNYRKVFYEHIVLKKMIIDLGTYCETLERALTKFHSEKMSKINRLIRELWRSIYRGNDIDYIQINTEEVKGTNKKRSYTYRVVQSKNDVIVDMRGRCSAGQRVLACLVIRIALAETFSSNCGVLALDEPTTNLDRINIQSLCEALNRIVEERESQSNFMLLVITHDEEFITELGRVMSYYRVSRDSSGKSMIQKLRV